MYLGNNQLYTTIALRQMNTWLLGLHLGTVSKMVDDYIKRSENRN